MINTVALTKVGSQPGGGKKHEKMRTKIGDVWFAAGLLWRCQPERDCSLSGWWRPVWAQGSQFCRSEQTAWTLKRKQAPMFFVT